MNKLEAKKLRAAVKKSIDTAVIAAGAGAFPPDEAKILRLEAIIAQNNVAWLISCFTKETPHD